MKNAKTMFEELGYRQVKEIDVIEYNNYKDSTSVYYEISFIKPFRNLEIVPKINGNAHHFVRLSPKLLNAINKQMEELGWTKSVI